MAGTSREIILDRIRRRGPGTLLVVLGALLVLLLNWWYSPGREIDAAGEAAAKASERLLRADRALFDVLNATSGDGYHTAECLGGICYIRFARMYFHREQQDSYLARQAAGQWTVSVEVALRPVPRRIGTVLPTQFTWEGRGWRWEVDARFPGAERKLFSGTWDEISKIPAANGTNAFALYLDAMAGDIEGAMRKELTSPQ